jgi:uncharacterized protein (DUF1778 family)
MTTTSTAEQGIQAVPPAKRRHDTKPERFQARISARQRDLFQRAAAIEGRSVTDFVLAHAQEAAQRTIEHESLFVLSKRDSEAFLTALQAPQPPTPEILSDIRAMQAFFGEISDLNE